MKPVGLASKDNYFDPLSSGSIAIRPQYVVVSFEYQAFGIHREAVRLALLIRF
jgi:hypothetical protein